MYDLNIIERGIRGIFAREFITRQRKSRHPLFCSVVDSDKQSEKYNAISTLPQMQAMTDERVLGSFTDYSYELANTVYATGIRIPRTLFEFDQTGQVRTLVGSLGSRTANFPDKLIWTVIKNNGNGYDGVAFFSTAHNLGNGVSQSNLLTGAIDNQMIDVAGDATKRNDLIALFQLELVRAKAQLLSLKDDRGEPWHDDALPESLAIVCHPKLEFFIRTALEATIINDTGNLTLKSVGQIIPVNYDDPFTDSSGNVLYGTWYLVKLDTPVKPFIFQRFGPKVNFPDSIPEADQSVLQALNSLEVQAIMRTGQNIDAQTFFNDEFLFGARGIYGAGYGIWQNAVKTTGAVFTS